MRTQAHRDRTGTIAISLVVGLSLAVYLSEASAQPLSGTVPVGPYGHELYYEVEGAGEPVVLVHGLTLDLRMWDAQMDVLTSQYQVIRYDAVGHGRSSGVEGDVPNGTFRQWDHLLEVLDALEIDKAHIVGLSMGGSIAMDFAIEHPDRIQTMTSIDGVLEGYQLPDTPGELGERFVSYLFASRDEGLQAAMQRWMSDPIFAPAMANPELRAQLEEIVLEGHVSLGAGAAFAWPNLQKFASLDAINRLHEIEAPSLILVGELDAPDFHIEADYLDRDIPDSAKFVVPAAGHMANMEQPQIVNDILLDFLAAHPISVAPTLPDYNGDGLVEQSDLDLVLLNWGAQLADPLAVGWIIDVPGGAVDQEELDKVLVNWGLGAVVGTSSVPEPATVAMAVVFCMLTVGSRALRACMRQSQY